MSDDVPAGTTYARVGSYEVDGVPVRSSMPVLSLPRWRSGAFDLRPLPMVELREQGDGGGSVAARWPEPFPDQDLGGTDA